MRYQKLGTSSLNASILSFGTWGIGGGSVWSDDSPTVSRVEELLDCAKDLGINYVDTAPVYGTGVSEQLLGEALKNGRRDSFLLQTKASLNWRGEGGNFHYERDGVTVNNDTSAAAIRKDVEASLLRMQTDWIDVLVIHYVCSSWPVEETMQECQRLLQEGKIRAIGLSNSKPEDLDAYSAYGPIALVQEQYSLLAPYHGEAYFPTTKKHGTTFQVYGALEEGFLTSADVVDRTFPTGDVRGKLPWIHEPYRSGIHHLFEVLQPLCEKYNCSPSVLIEAWTLKQSDSLNLLIGFRHSSSMIDSIRALDLPLTTEDAERIRLAATPIQVKELDK